MSDGPMLLADAIREEKGLHCCARHATTVWFDEPYCPLCVILAENMACRRVPRKENDGR